MVGHVKSQDLPVFAANVATGDVSEGVRYCREGAGSEV